MDTRQGGRAGHSQTGRRLLGALGRHGGDILAAGSSDWVVWPTTEGAYPSGEAHFLEQVLETMHLALASHPDLDKDRWEAWLGQRRAQLKAGKLIFIAHQLDVCGRL
jgi:hypothetical protein